MSTSQHSNLYTRLYYYVRSNIPLILFGITTVLLFADQNLLAPNLSAAADEFGFSDIERDRKLGGEVALAFFVLGAPASYIVACVGDLYPVRVLLFVAMVWLGEGACGATYWTTTYRGFYVCRALTGISVGGASPLIFSILSDIYPAGKLSMVSALVGMGMGTGIIFGQSVAGFVGPVYGWRLPFLLVSLPALMTSAMVAFLVKEPAKGSSETGTEMQCSGVLSGGRTHDGHLDEIKQQAEHHKIEEQVAPPPHAFILINTTESLTTNDRFNQCTKNDQVDQTQFTTPTHNTSSSQFTMKIKVLESLQSLQHILKTRSVLLLMLQGVPGCVPWGIVNTFLNDYLSEDQGMSVQGATTVVGIFGAGVFIGQIIGGKYGDILYNKSPEQPALLAGSSTILSCLPFWFLLNIKPKTSWTMLWICYPLVSLIAGTGTGITGPIVKATVSRVTLPRRRGQAYALLNTFDDLGRGLGPMFVASLLTSLGGNRRKSFNVGMLGWVACGLLNLGVYFTAKRDVEKMRCQLAIEGFNDDCDD